MRQSAAASSHLIYRFIFTKNWLDTLGRGTNINNAVISGSNQMAEEGGDVPDPGVGGGGGGRCVGGSASVCRGGAATSAAALPSSSKTAETSTKEKATASSVARKKHAPWFAAEDQRLRTIVAEEQRQRKGEAIRWTRVAEAHGGSRTAKQLRERWLHVLDPSRKQGEWTEEETTLVIRLQKELGNR